MIIEIDGYYHQVLLWGKRCSKQQLNQKYQQAKEETYELKNLPQVFCRLHNYEQISYDCDIKIEFVIDTDTDRIYLPSY